MRAVHGSAVLYPSDPNQTAQLVALMAERSGISYLRTTRAATPVIYAPDTSFTVGGSQVVRSSENDQLTIVAAGITLHEAISACDQLTEDGIHARLIDLYSVKPVDDAGLAAAARATGGRVLVVEDHWPEGGIGSAVLESLAGSGVDVTFRHLAPNKLVGSGTPAQLMDDAGISANHIVAAVRALVGQS
jgi:transketolase